MTFSLLPTATPAAAPAPALAAGALPPASPASAAPEATFQGLIEALAREAALAPAGPALPAAPPLAGNSLPPPGEALPPAEEEAGEDLPVAVLLAVAPPPPPPAAPVPALAVPDTVSTDLPDEVSPAPGTGPVLAPEAAPVALSVRPASREVMASAPVAVEGDETVTPREVMPQGSRAAPVPAEVVAEEGLLARAEPAAPAPAAAPSSTAGAAAVAALAVEGAREGARQYGEAATARAVVALPVGRPGWGEAVVERLMWFSAQQLSSAEIHLNPAELGPLQVRINTQQEQASVYFTSAHPAVREALDQALPRLREMLDGQGVQLLDAGVSDQRPDPHRSPFAAPAGAGGGEDEAGPVTEPALRVGRGLVDAYA